MRLSSLMACLALAGAAALPCFAMGAGNGPPLSGAVLEVLNVPSYTYMRVQTAQGPVWAAVGTAGVKVGDRVTIADTATMQNFESKTLKRSFDSIVFGRLAPTGMAAAGPAMGAAPSAMPPSMLSPHGKTAPSAAAPNAAPAPAVAPVAKASGAEARTVAEVIKTKAALKDKTVLVQARVVKVNNGIMGKNWLHVQDGSGQAQDGSNDLMVTTQDKVAVGEVVTLRGTVRTDVTVGPGYTWAVLVEDAKLRR
jgi:hypothetical protein